MPISADFYRYLGEPARRGVAITADAGDIANAPSRALFVSADANVTLVLADDPTASPVLYALKGGQVYPFAVRRMTALSAGTVIALF